ncbi:MAG: transporter [Daejeonella sp.]
MQTDRPDITENPYTVDAGHFQIETDLIKRVENKTSEQNVIQNYYNLMNLKLGLSNSTDLQLVVQSFVHQQNKSSNFSERTSGFGDLSIRLKQNIFGNDKGKSALGIMPYINIPVSKFSEGNKIDGGIIIPFSTELKNDWSFSAQAELDIISEGEKYQSSLLNSITFGKYLGKNWGLFLESYDTYNFSINEFAFYLDAGLIYSINKNLNLDAGFNYGVTKNSDKTIFLGFSFRH